MRALTAVPMLAPPVRSRLDRAYDHGRRLQALGGRELGTRARLAHTAALLVTVLVEGEHALGAHELGRLGRVRESVLDADAIVLLHLVEQAIRLRVQPPRVQAARARGAISPQRAAVRQGGLSGVRRFVSRSAAPCPGCAGARAVSSAPQRAALRRAACPLPATSTGLARLHAHRADPPGLLGASAAAGRPGGQQPLASGSVGLLIHTGNRRLSASPYSTGNTGAGRPQIDAGPQRRCARLNTRNGRPVRCAYLMSATSSAPLKAIAMSLPNLSSACRPAAQGCTFSSPIIPHRRTAATRASGDSEKWQGAL